ncbi:unnamed protein product [Lactuca saligna]|uniref:Uncharacterized protein n=1 Tax=Lactuca saligna TaxID=75948 RepID=A0AA36DWB5_LACSI|nr:unnamed protein product [Lactuca saligna]
MTFMGVKRENDQTCGDVFSAFDPIAALGLLHHHRIKTTRTLVMVLVLDGAAVFIGWKVRLSNITLQKRYAFFIILSILRLSSSSRVFVSFVFYVGYSTLQVSV